MRLNQKGFAVSTILYGLLLVMSFVIFLLLSLTSFEQKNNNDYTKTIISELNDCMDEGSC